MAIKTQAYPRMSRLSGRLQFKAVFDGGLKTHRGPLVVRALAREVEGWRLGISISRAVGTAVKRNRIKRLLREAFRRVRGELPGAYDLVIVVRPHDTLSAGEYRTIVSDSALSLHGKWERRSGGGFGASP